MSDPLFRTGGVPDLLGPYLHDATDVPVDVGVLEPTRKAPYVFVFQPRPHAGMPMAMARDATVKTDLVIYSAGKDRGQAVAIGDLVREAILERTAHGRLVIADGLDLSTLELAVIEAQSAQDGGYSTQGGQPQWSETFELELARSVTEVVTP